MPILIDEVVISVQVDNRSSGGSNVKPAENETRKQIVEDCVEQVLEILKQRKES